MHDMGFYVMVFAGWIVLGIGVGIAWAVEAVGDWWTGETQVDREAKKREKIPTWPTLIKGPSPEDPSR